MKKWFWIGAAVLLAVCAAGAWFAFQRPDFMVGFIAATVAAVYQLLKPQILKRMSPQDEREWDELQKRGASKEEMLTWQRQRRRRKLQKGSL